MSVTASVHPARVGIGDPFEYVVVAHGTRVAADPGPFEQVRPASVHHSGGAVTIVQTLVCVDRGCAPNDTSRKVVLPAPRVDGVRGRPAAITVEPHVPAAAIAAPRAVYREQTTIGGSAAPFGLVAAVLIVAAVLLALAGLLLLVRAARPAADRRPLDLADALRLLRESAVRPAADRRRASDLVARLAQSDEATTVAWAPPSPDPDDVRTLADRIEGAT